MVLLALKSLINSVNRHEQNPRGDITHTAAQVFLSATLQLNKIHKGVRIRFESKSYAMKLDITPIFCGSTLFCGVDNLFECVFL